MRSRILTPRTAGILGITGLTVSATVGFAVAATADTGTFGSGSKSSSASPSATGSSTSKSASPSPTPTPTKSSTSTPSASVSMVGDGSVKSGDKATYTITLTVKNGPLKDASLVLGGSKTIKWSGGCESVSGLTCKLGDVTVTRLTTASYTAPKVSEDTAKKLTVTVKSGTSTVATGTKSLTVEKAGSSSSPTKSPSPTKTSEKPTASHKPSSHAPKPAPSNSGHVPLPDINPPDVPSSVPSIPVGSQPPFPNGTPTGLPTLPSVAPSPEGSPRVPNVAEPPRKASGEVQTDAVSLPAAAAAAFLGLGAGTVITRSVRRRGLMRTIGRHRD